MPKRFLDFRPDGIALLTKRGETADLIPQGQIREMLYVHETLTSSGTTERQIAATLKNANVVAGGTRPDLRRFKFGHFRGLDISLGDGSRRFFKMPIGELPLLQLEIYKNKASYPEPRHVRRRLLRGGYAPFEE